MRPRPAHPGLLASPVPRRRAHHAGAERTRPPGGSGTGFPEDPGAGRRRGAAGDHLRSAHVPHLRGRHGCLAAERSVRKGAQAVHRPPPEPRVRQAPGQLQYRPVRLGVQRHQRR